MFTSRPDLTGTFGMVASTHWLASQSGMAVLERGGNAFDAAVAAGFVLQVVEPDMNGPGGDLSLLLSPAGGDPVVLCGQGPAPAAAGIEAYRQAGLAFVPGTGLLAATVPGATPAWLTLLRDHGTMTPEQVLGYAIGYADHGFGLSPAAVQVIARMSDSFRTAWPSSAATWLPAPRAGTRFRNPVLAETFRRLASGTGSREARCDFALRQWSGGFVAEAVEGFVHRPVLDGTGHRHAGVITAGDLAGWQPGYEPTFATTWRGHRVHKGAGWSQGPVLAEILQLLDPLLGDRWTGTDAGQIHGVVEAVKLAFADRDAWLGDAPDAPDPALLLTPDLLTARRRLIGADASHELRPADLPGRPARLPSLPDAPGAERGGEPTFGGGQPTLGGGRGDTCHLDVADRWGNVVSATPSGGWLQSSPTVPGLGFCLGTRLQMTWLEPGLPSSLHPGRRPRTTLTPSLTVAPDGAVTAFGTPGGDQQEQWPLVFWLHHLLGGDSLQTAIERPSWHSASLISSFDPRTWDPARLVVEERMPAPVVADLRARGHRVQVVDGWSLGRISAVRYDPSTRSLAAAANPRGQQGYAVGR